MESLSCFVCVTRWLVDDIVQGVSDIGVRKLVQNAGGRFLLHQNLHAKYYRFDGEVFVGSANLTDAALGWSKLPNLEILSRAGDEFGCKAFEEELLVQAREIGDLEEEGWKLAMERAQRQHKASDHDESVSRKWVPKARDIDSVLHVYSGRDDAIASEDEQRAAREDIRALEIPDGLDETGVLVWISSQLVSNSFVSSVVARRGMDSDQAAKELAEEYRRGVVEARRDLEAVHNWLSALAAGKI